MSQFLNDQFTGANGQTLEAYNAGWVKISGLSGPGTLSNGRVQQAGGTVGYRRSDAVPPNADYSVSADIYVVTGTAGAAAGVCGRVLSTEQTLYHARYLSGTGIQLLRYVFNGSATTLGTYAFSPAVGDVFNIKLEMIGTALKVYLNNDPTPVISVTNTTITAAGNPGLRLGSAATGILQIDNLVADDLLASGSTTTVTPDPAALVVTGYAPSIAQTANQDVSPAPAALTVTGYAPTVTQSSANSISPTPAALVVEGFAPTISQTQRLTVSPAPAGLIVQGWAPTITQTGKQPDPEIGPAPGGGGGGGSIREVRAFAEELDRARKPTRAEKKRRRQAIETAVLELLPDVPAAERAAPVIAQLVARELPPATWAPIYGPRPVVLPTAVVDDVHARVAEWLAEQAHQALLAELEDDFEVELLLLG